MNLQLLFEFVLLAIFDTNTINMPSVTLFRVNQARLILLFAMIGLAISLEIFASDLLTNLAKFLTKLIKSNRS